MPPIFNEKWFDFGEGQVAPVHDEDLPILDTDEFHDRGKWFIVEADCDEPFVIACDIDDMATAVLLGEARRRKVNLDDKRKFGEVCTSLPIEISVCPPSDVLKRDRNQMVIEL